MQNNNFYNKLLNYSMIIIFSIVLILGIITVSICSSAYKKTELERLENTGNLFMGCVAEEYNDSDYESLKNLQGIFKAEDNADIYLYDEKGICILPADSKSTIPENIKSEIDKGRFLELISDDVSHEEPHTIYGDKFFLKNGDTMQKVYITVYGSTQNISMFTMEVTAIYASVAIVIMLIFMLVIRRKVKKYSNYSSDVIRILKKYSHGDFSEKIVSDSPMSNETVKYINRLASIVETSEETSKTFIANVSHELRTPITTIGGFVDGILDGTIPKNRRNDYLVIVSNEIQRLKILITSMLNMSRFESGTLKPNFQETNLTDLVIKTAFMFEKKIEAKNVEVEELDADNLIAEVDPDLMQQVIYNLIENAVKFVNTGGKLSFRFEKQGSTCIVGIRNTGEGLKDSEIPQVFDRFYKTDSSRGKDTTGLGLGLSISRKIVHINNSQIVVKSVYGEYTEFQLQIPEKQNQS